MNKYQIIETEEKEDYFMSNKYLEYLHDLFVEAVLRKRAVFEKVPKKRFIKNKSVKSI